MSSGHTLKLNSGYEMDIVGLGTWKSPKGKVKDAVESAIDCGYRHIDCAWIYDNEGEVGDAIEKKIKEGKIKREDLFITSKLWGCFHEASRVRGALMESLKNLKLKYLDLYLIHFPVGYKFHEGNPLPFLDDKNEKMDSNDIDYMESYRELEKLQKEGLIRSIGVSNFSMEQVGRVLKEAEVKPAVNQIEIHPYFSQEPLVEYCQKNGVVVTAYSPFSSPDSPWLKEDYVSVLENSTIKSIADKLKRSTAQVILRYLMQRNLIVIPKSVTPARIQSNYNVFDFKLDQGDMDKISKLNKNYRTCGFTWDKNHKYFPFGDDYKQ